VNKVFFGDCRETMRELIAQGVRVQTCVTSPPYFGLRDYGHPGQFGLEATPAEYVAAMVDVFRLVRELLADDGTLWLNLGDSYAGHNARGFREGNEQKNGGASNKNWVGYVDGLKPKDLIGIPWRVAFALQADGWYLRQDIIWHKPNPMPESVTDRCTKAHEYIFLMSKSERYYFNADAIAENSVGENPISRMKAHEGLKHAKLQSLSTTLGTPADGKRNRRSVWAVPTQPYSGAHFATFPPKLIEPCILAGSRAGDIVLDPFFGSGTTGEVAQFFGRQWIGCELNEEYAGLQKARVSQCSLLAV